MADVNAGRNFLFGLLALQNGLINHDQLVAAVWAWSCDQGCQIADYLVNRGVLDASQRSVVQAMVAQHEKKHGDSTEQSSAAITAGRSTSESLAALGDTEIGETLTQAGAGPASTQIDSGLDHQWRLLRRLDHVRRAAVPRSAASRPRRPRGRLRGARHRTAP